MMKAWTGLAPATSFTQDDLTTTRFSFRSRSKKRILWTMALGISSGKQALDAVMLERGGVVAENIILIEHEEIAGSDYYPSVSTRQKWARRTRMDLHRQPEGPGEAPAAKARGAGKVPLKSYERLHAPR